VREVILNDTCGTLNRNFESKLLTQTKINNGKYHNKALAEYKKFMEDNKDGN
jgi:hypothetical protein